MTVLRCTKNVLLARMLCFGALGPHPQACGALCQGVFTGCDALAQNLQTQAQSPFLQHHTVRLEPS